MCGVESDRAAEVWGSSDKLEGGKESSEEAVSEQVRWSRARAVRHQLPQLSWKAAVRAPHLQPAVRGAVWTAGQSWKCI